MRASWRRLIFFFICIAVGVAAIVALRSVIQSVQAAMATESRALIAADVVLRSNNEWSEQVFERLASEQEAGRVTGVAQSVELATMVRPAGAVTPRTTIVELRAVEPGFPFYGTLTLREGPYTHELVANHGVLVRPELLVKLGVSVGDELLVGTEAFEIRGTIESEPGANLGLFSLGPRIIVDRADLDATGLIGFGSRASYEMQLRVPEDAIRGVTGDLGNAFANDFINVRSYRRSEDRLGRNLTRAENYLSLVGLVVLMLGGIGVSSVTRVFVQQKVRSIAILKCIGTTSGQVLAVYLTQVLLLGLAGSVLGVGLAAVAVAAVPSMVGDLATLFSVEYGLTAAAMAQGMAVGLLISVLFAVVPLLEVRHVKPSLLLRQDETPRGEVDWLKWGVGAGVAAVLVAVASWQAGDIEVGLILCAGLVGTAVVLHLAGMVLIRSIQPLTHARSFALRHAVRQVARPGNQTRVILLAVGLGAFFILGVRMLQVNLLSDFEVQLGEGASDMFLMDVQADQRDSVARQLDEDNGDAPPPTLIPVLRARVVGVEGRNVSLDSFDDVRRRGRISREYTVTYRAELQENETLLDGGWWGEPFEDPLVSIEEEIRERLDIEIGDRMRFDVLGQIVTARVASVRKVDYRDFRAGGFVFVFSPRTFEEIPHGYIASARGPEGEEMRARSQAAMVDRFPNVSVIDLRAVLDTIQGVVSNVTIAVSVVGGLVLMSGMLILIGAVSMTKFRRVYEAAILKTLGANSRLIATMVFMEYGVLGAIAGGVGALGAVALSWGIARFAFDMPWAPLPSLVAVGVLATTVLVAVVGVAASYDVLRHKPLGTLRAE